ncbi:MAG TPA: right-handed parallel beta-helix repeat-containing protein [Tepidisphaeraceae bacterium]|nr:right-handed parallel beta-helix repeat-containing protein [Tepidisphaeraceae bacterium]
MALRPLLENLESRTFFAIVAMAAAVDCAPARRVEAFAYPMPTALAAVAVSPIEVQLSWSLPFAQSAARSALTAKVQVSNTRYAVERAFAGGTFAAVGDVDASATSFVDLGLRSDGAYQYRLRRIDGSNALTAPASVVTPRYDAGLTGTFQSPTATTGRTLNILSFGATSNNASNDDAAAIRAAISEAVAGDEVYIPNGVFHIKARDIQLKSGVSVRGQSMSGTILSAQFTDQGASNPNSQVFRVEAGRSNVTFSNFRIEMSAGQTMQYGIALGSGSTGVSNTRRVAIRNVNIEGFERFGVAIRNADNVLIENSLIRNATALGGGGQGYGVMIGYPQTFNVWVKGNTIGPTIRHAVIIQYQAHHNLIENNIAIENTEDAYDLHGEDEYSNELRYNIAYGGDGFGFGIGNTGSTHDDSGPNNWIHHNEVYNSQGGLNIILGSDRQFIEDNYFHNNLQEGIKVNNGGGADLWFLRNRIENNARGVRLDDAVNPLLIDNVITGNAGYGVSVGATTTGFRIFRNDLRNNTPGLQLHSLDGQAEDNLF